MGCFYNKGLHFECQGCSYCCSVEPGYVFLSSEEIDRIASFLSLSEESFIEMYCRKVGDSGMYRVSLKEKDNYDCIFLNNGKCSIYDVRPVQCRTYPFWKNIVESKKTWDNESGYCPGINKGMLHTKKEIDASLKECEKTVQILITEKNNA